NWQSAEDDVAELVAAQFMGGRHYPPHAECRPDLFDVAAAGWTRADHFLERNDIRTNLAKHARNPLGPRAPIHSATAMDIVSDDAQPPVLSHYVMIDRDAARALFGIGAGARGIRRLRQRSGRAAAARR